jgi:hypothetical protein
VWRAFPVAERASPPRSLSAVRRGEVCLVS